MNVKRFAILVVALMLSACGYWLYENLIWTEVRIPGIPKGEAVTNNLYAAQRLLMAFGAKAQSTQGFRDLPEGDPARSALIFPTMRKTLSPRQRQSLLDWVNKGGHLVVVTYTLEDDGDQPDPLLASFGVHQKMKGPPPKAAAKNDNADDKENNDADGTPDQPKSEQPPKRRQAPPPPPIRRLPRGGYAVDGDQNCAAQTETATGSTHFPAATLKVCFDSRFRMVSDNPPLWSAQDADGIHALSLAHGKGRVTVMTDYRFMQNERIGQADHADFLVALLGPELSGLNVTLVPREDVDGLRTLIWRYGWTVVLTLVLLIAVALWRDGARFGPLAPNPVAVRRSLIEHVRAGGEYLWRRDQARTLWQSTLNAARRRIARALPTARTHEQLVKQVAAKTGLNDERVSQALIPVSHPGADAFLRAINTLEQMRKKL